MLSTELSTIFMAGAVFFALLLSVYLFARQFRSEKYVRQMATWLADELEAKHADNLSIKKLADIEIQLTELTDSYESLLTSHRKLRARISMRANRQSKSEPKTLDSGSEASDDVGRANLKSELRDKAKAKGYL